jgi:hypothetical protein
MFLPSCWQYLCLFSLHKLQQQGISTNKQMSSCKTTVNSRGITKYGVCNNRLIAMFHFTSQAARTPCLKCLIHDQCVMEYHTHISLVAYSRWCLSAYLLCERYYQFLPQISIWWSLLAACSTCTRLIGSIVLCGMTICYPNFDSYFIVSNCLKQASLPFTMIFLPVHSECFPICLGYVDQKFVPYISKWLSRALSSHWARYNRWWEHQQNPQHQQYQQEKKIEKERKEAKADTTYFSFVYFLRTYVFKFHKSDVFCSIGR